MSNYGQFCAVARAHEALGGRWTLLIVRELLMGSRRFNDIRRGVPRISPTMLSARLQELAAIGVIKRREDGDNVEYALTEAGEELIDIVKALGVWGQRWLPRNAKKEDSDLDPLLVDMARRADFDALPAGQVLIRFDIRGRDPRFLLLRKPEASLCTQNPGFPETLIVKAPLAALVAWWRGDATYVEAQRMGLAVAGSHAYTRDFPRWFKGYLFAGVEPAAERKRA
jgi:DNA-binding HxlR family transcriptional regulator